MLRARWLVYRCPFGWGLLDMRVVHPRYFRLFTIRASLLRVGFVIGALFSRFHCEISIRFFFYVFLILFVFMISLVCDIGDPYYYRVL